jgi:hypothetical protein
MGAVAEFDEDEIPSWQVAGDWFDVYSCYVPCPCTFAQPPTNNACEVLFACRINEGHFGATPMAGLKVVILASLVGNVWEGAKLDAGVIFDASADDQQRRGLELIFTGKAGGWMVSSLRQYAPLPAWNTPLSRSRSTVHLNAGV